MVCKDKTDMVTWLRKRRSAVTFDLGSAGIRACQLEGSDRTPQARDDLRVERGVPGAAMAEGDAPPTLRVEAGQVARLMGQGAFHGHDVGLIVSPPEAHFYPLHMPERILAEPAERVQQALKWEISQETRQSVDDLEVRYWSLPRGRGMKVNVMAVALPTQTTLAWFDQLAQHNLQLKRIDAAPCALIRLARQVWCPGDGDLWGVLDLGQRHTTLTLAIGDVPAYIRTLSANSHEWTMRLANAFEVTYEVAEEIKRSQTMLPYAGEPVGPLSRAEDLGGDDLSGTLARILNDSLRNLVQEVGRCFSYLMQNFPEHTVRGLLLAGGGADLAGLSSRLSAELDIPVQVLCNRGSASAWEHPLDGVNLAPQSAAAVGGALLDLEHA